MTCSRIALLCIFMIVSTAIAENLENENLLALLDDVTQQDKKELDALYQAYKRESEAELAKRAKRAKKRDEERVMEQKEIEALRGYVSQLDTKLKELKVKKPSISDLRVPVEPAPSQNQTEGSYFNILNASVVGIAMFWVIMIYALIERYKRRNQILPSPTSSPAPSPPPSPSPPASPDPYHQDAIPPPSSKVAQTPPVKPSATSSTPTSFPPPAGWTAPPSAPVKAPQNVNTAAPSSSSRNVPPRPAKSAPKKGLQPTPLPRKPATKPAASALPR